MTGFAYRDGRRFFPPLKTFKDSIKKMYVPDPMECNEDFTHPPGYRPKSGVWPWPKQQEDKTNEKTPILLDHNEIMKMHFDSKLRILRCCMKLRMSEYREINYPDLQKIYEQEYGKALDKKELKKLFGNQHAYIVLKSCFSNEIDVIAAADNSDKCIKLRAIKDLQEIIEEVKEAMTILFG